MKPETAGIFDGCAVLMRRLLEVMLILAFRKLGIEAAIQEPDGSYKMLEGIINDAKTYGTLKLSRDSKEVLEVFRKLGNSFGPQDRIHLPPAIHPAAHHGLPWHHH